VTAKYTCKNFIQKSYWYSAITVDLVGRPDTTPTATTRTQTLYWLIPIEGVVAVWKSPALSSGLAIVDEVSEPTRGSHRGVRVIR